MDEKYIHTRLSDIPRGTFILAFNLPVSLLYSFRVQSTHRNYVTISGSRFNTENCYTSEGRLKEQKMDTKLTQKLVTEGKRWGYQSLRDASCGWV